jgi:organic radical activating enzyme
LKIVEMLWFLQSRCNYDCPYCSYTDSDNLRAVFLKQEKHFSVAQWSDAWRSFHEKHGMVYIYISGAGEPTLYPDFIGLLKAISRWHRVSFDTNLSWPQATWRRFAAEIDASKVSVESSFHPSGGAELEVFTSKAAFLRENGFALNCRLVAHPQLLGKIGEYRSYFESKKLPFVLTPFQGKFDGMVYPREYTPQEKRMIFSAAEQGAPESGSNTQLELVRHLAEQDAQSPFGKLCRAGHQYGCIMPDASVYRCQEYGMQGRETLGNFFDEGFKLNDSAAICRSTVCGIGYRWLVEETERYTNGGEMRG